MLNALHYQLSSTRAEGGLEAVVLVDGSGCLVAGAGCFAMCDELSALAPLMARPGEVMSPDVRDRIDELMQEVEVRTLKVDGVEAFLCARGEGQGRGESMARAAAGCLRIMRSAT